MTADANQIKNLFNDNGFLIALDVLDEKELKNFCKEFEELEKDYGKAYTQYHLHNTHLQYEWVMNLACHPNILKIITSLLGPNIILLDTRFICKYPICDVPYKDNKAPHAAWHQDITYWGCKGGPVVSVWLAFDYVDAENGGLQFIAGSHKQGILQHLYSEDSTNKLPASLEIPKRFLNVEDLVQCSLKPGQMSVHNGLTVHSSEPNRSNKRRCGFVIRYIPTTAYPDKEIVPPRTFPATVLVAGTDDYKQFENHAPKFFSKTL